VLLKLVASNSNQNDIKCLNIERVANFYSEKEATDLVYWIV